MLYVLPAILLAIPLWSGIAFGSGLPTTRDMTIPPAPPGISILELPGCLTSNMTDDPGTHECLVAKTAYALPDFCSRYPATRNCVILLAPAFCFDGDVLSKGSMQECLALIPQGPCKANPTGRACSSGLFAGFELITNPIPPNRIHGANNGQQWPGIFIPSAGSPDVLFGGASDPVWDPRLLSNNGWGSTIWCVGQFFEGVAKDLVNTGIEMAELAITPARLVWKADCWMAKETAHLISSTYGDTMDAACDIFIDTISIAGSWLDEHELDISNKYQSWGATTSEVVQFLMGAPGVIKAFTMGRKLAKLFLVIKDAKGSYLKAATDIGEIIILRLGGKGEAATMKEAEAQMLREDLETKGFDDLVHCGGLKDMMTGDNPLFVCVPPDLDEAASNAIVDAFLDDLPAIEGEASLISNPARASVGRVAEVARSAQPAIEEAALRTEAVGMSSDETRLPMIEDVIDPRGKRPAEFPPPGNEFGPPRTQRSRVVSDIGQGSGSAAEVPRSPAWPQPQFDMDVIDDALAPPRPGDPFPPPPDQLELYPVIDSDVNFELNFRRMETVFAKEGVTESVMDDFQRAFEHGIPDPPGNVRPPRYWRQLEKDGMNRDTIRERFIEEYELKQARKGFTKEFKSTRTDFVIKKLTNNLPDFQRLPRYTGPGHSRLRNYNVQYGNGGVMEKIRSYFRTLEYLGVPEFRFQDLLDTQYGSVIYPGFMSDGNDAVTDIFVFMETKARVFGPLVERFAADACIQSSGEAGDLVYELMGRVRMKVATGQMKAAGRGWAYVFQLIEG